MLTFRSSKIVYYGPHSCSNCGANIVKMGVEFGGNMFDQPEGPIYPNTEWHVHVCDPKRVAQKPKPTIPSAASAPSQLPKFQYATCKGSYALGSACGNCERCELEKANINAGGISGRPESPRNL